jgi:hypothetical protein
LARASVTFASFCGLIEIMRLGPVTAALLFLLAPLRAQDCPAISGVGPNAKVSATLDATNCQLTDGSAYMPYRLDLPVRGQIQIDLGGATANLALILRDGSGAKIASGTSIHRAIEAGSYVLLINGQTPADAGPYTITTAFTAEPGMLCSNFPSIGRHQTVAAEFGGAGCLLPDGSPYEAYSMITDGDGTLTITVSSQDFTPVVALRSGDGRLVNSSASGTMSALVTGDSQYALVLTSADHTGAYQLTTSFQSGADETCRSQKTITDSTTDSAAISGTSCYVTLFDNGDQLYYNYYVLTLASAGIADLSAVSPDFTATLNLLDENGNLLVSDSGGGGLDADGNPQSSVRVQLPAGTYRLQVFSDVPSGGKYSLSYAFTAGNPKPCVPTAVSPGDLLTGGLSARSCRTAAGLADLYTMTLPAAGTLSLDMSSFDFDTRLVLRDSKDNLIVRNDDVDGVTAAHVAADLPAGVYTIATAATSGAGNYRATSAFTAHDIPGCTFAQSIDLNGGYIQRLGPASCRGANGQPVDYYTFTLSVDSLVLAVMTSSELDGYLTLYDSNGTALRSDDNSYGAADPLIVQYLPAGTYQLAARDVSGGPGGLYEIDLRTVSGPRPAFCTPRGTIAPGGMATGNITFTGCQYTDNSFADVYTLTLAADTQLDLRLNSTDFDAYLILLDAKGNLVDVDDDSGGGTNSRITDSLPAGTYYVVAKPFGDYTQHGAYTLAANSIN